MSPVPTQGVYDFDGEDYAANPNKYDDGVINKGIPLFGLQELLHDIPLVLAEVKRLREELRITQSNFSMVRNALANQYPEIEEAIWKVIE